MIQRIEHIDTEPKTCRFFLILVEAFEGTRRAEEL